MTVVTTVRGSVNDSGHICVVRIFVFVSAAKVEESTQAMVADG